MGTIRMLLELRDLFGILLLWEGEMDDVLGMIRLSRASRRREGRRACFRYPAGVVAGCEKR